MTKIPHFQTREALLKGKAQYSSSPCTNLFRSAAFDNANVNYFFTKQATLTRRSMVFNFPVQLVFPVQTLRKFQENLQILTISSFTDIHDKAQYYKTFRLILRFSIISWVDLIKLFWSH